MKRNLILLLLNFLFLTGYAQNEIPPIYVGLQVSPNFSYRVLSNSSGESSVDDDIDYLNNREEAAFGYRIAAVSGIRISNNWTLEAGVAYLRNCTRLNLTFGDNIDPRRPGFVNENEFTEGELETCLSYVGIPIRIVWGFGTETTKVLASFGLSPQILLDQNTRAKLSNEDDTEERNIDSFEDATGFNLSPSLGIGAEYTLNENFFLRAEGIARFGVVNVNEDSPINSYIYSSELSIGIHYNLVKNSSSTP
ncbi:MAG: outer membrane beta-barrel protein [Cryomorphaceae bacterium]